MIELNIKLDEIDYSGIAEYAIPVIEEKLGQKGSELSKLMGKVPQFAVKAALNTFLKTLSQEQKDDIVLGLINKYEDKIIKLLQKTAEDKGINITIKSLSVTKTDSES